MLTLGQRVWYQNPFEGWVQAVVTGVEPEGPLTYEVRTVPEGDQAYTRQYVRRGELHTEDEHVTACLMDEVEHGPLVTFTSSPITVKTRKLKVGWTVESHQDLDFKVGPLPPFNGNKKHGKQPSCP